MADKIQLRRDIESEWFSEDPILASGEVGVTLENPVRFRIGNGGMPWTSLLDFVGVDDTQASTYSTWSSQKIQSELLSFSADQIVYINLTSGLTAENVQDAIDEVVALLDALAEVARTGAAEDVSYSNLTSGLTSTDAQGAIDELKEALDDVPTSAAAIKSLYESNPDTNAYTDAEKSKLSGIQAGAQVNVATDLAQGTRTTTTVPITSSTGTSATLAAATTTLAGVMSSADKTKLDGITTGATANQTDAFLLNRDNHTGSQAISTVTGLQTALDTKVDKVAGKQLSTEDYTSAEKTKLSGIADGATANSTDSFLLDRANHTGTQAASTITGLGAVATSGAAGDVSISDAGNYFTGANVEVALQEVGAMIGDIGSALDLINGEVV